MKISREQFVENFKFDFKYDKDRKFDFAIDILCEIVNYVPVFSMPRNFSKLISSFEEKGCHSRIENLIFVVNCLGLGILVLPFRLLAIALDRTPTLKQILPKDPEPIDPDTPPDQLRTVKLVMKNPDFIYRHPDSRNNYPENTRNPKVTTYVTIKRPIVRSSN